MRVVADLPDYLGRGGPHLHDVELFDDGDSSRLAVSFTVVAAGRAWPEPDSRPPDTLASQLSEVHFRYRGLDEENALGEWQEQWESPGVLPLQVSIERSEEHTSELQSLMRISYAVFCLKKKTKK